jgi:hypothetical protein
VKVPYNIANADYIRSQITAKIRAASATIVIVGATTSTSAWVQWEIEKSVAMANTVIGLKLSTAGAIPPALTDAGAKIIGWDVSKIVEELG